jgi:hypothetical protein
MKRDKKRKHRKSRSRRFHIDNLDSTIKTNNPFVHSQVREQEKASTITMKSRDTIQIRLESERDLKALKDIATATSENQKNPRDMTSLEAAAT